MTSSLNRLRDASFPSQTTTLSRSRRTFEFRVIFPDRTAQPAIVPTLEMWNVLRTSAHPWVDSLRVGSSIPSIAFRMSSTTS